MSTPAKYTVICGDDLFASHAAEEEALAQIGARLVVPPSFDEPVLIEACRQADGVMVNRARITRPIIEAMERCKVISAYGIGVDGIDVAAATQKRIPVVNIPGFCAEEVAEHAIMLLLAAAHKLPQQLRASQTPGALWSYKPYVPIFRLSGKTLGVVGLGHIGRIVTRMAKGLGMRVIGYEYFAYPGLASELGIELRNTVDEVLREADHVTLHVALNPATRGMMGEAQLRMMKPSAILINCSRGGVVNQKALVQALREGWIAGAGLDVLDPEPPTPETYDTLFKLDNVVITPHTSWYSEESRTYLQKQTAMNVVHVIRGEKPTNVVNADIYKS